TALNAAACRLLDIDADRAGRPLAQSVQGPGRDEVVALVQRSLAGRGARQEREVMVPGRGRDRHLAVTVVPLPGAPGSPPGANLVPGSLHEIIDETLSLYDGLFSDVTVERRLATDVPALRLDSDQMKRVLINLVDNAIDATEKRGRVTISTEFDRSQGRVR